MLKRFGVILSLVVGMMACTSDAQDKIKVACVGDSITYGMGVKQRKINCYPSKLQDLLGNAYEVKNFGFSARTLLKKGDKPYWNEEMYKEALAYKPNIVIIKLGTNDSKRKNWVHKADFAADLTEFAQSFQNLSSKPTVYLALPVPVEKSKWSITDTVIKNEIIPIIKDVAKQINCPIIDFYSAVPVGKNLFKDGVHPNADGALRMAQKAYSVLKDSGKSSEKNVK